MARHRQDTAHLLRRVNGARPRARTAPPSYVWPRPYRAAVSTRAAVAQTQRVCVGGELAPTVPGTQIFFWVGRQRATSPSPVPPVHRPTRAGFRSPGHGQGLTGTIVPLSARLPAVTAMDLSPDPLKLSQLTHHSRLYTRYGIGTRPPRTVRRDSLLRTESPCAQSLGRWRRSGLHPWGSSINCSGMRASRRGGVGCVVTAVRERV